MKYEKAVLKSLSSAWSLPDCISRPACRRGGVYTDAAEVRALVRAARPFATFPKAW